MSLTRRILVAGVICSGASFAACGGGEGDNLFNATGGSGAAAGDASPGGKGGAGGSVAQGGTGGAAQGGSSQGGSSQGGSSQGGSSQGGASGTGGTPAGGTAGSSGQGGTGGDGGVEACAVQSVPASRIESLTDLIVDRSGSMSDGVSGGQTKWVELRNAISAFFAEPESAPLVVAITLMPPANASLDVCDATFYQKPDVAAGLIGQGTGAAINSALAPVPADGTSPWSATFTGAIAYAKAQAIANPARNVSILMMGDAPATDCETNMSIISGIVAGGVSGTPSVRMHVIGLLVGGFSQDVTDMNSLATAGGTSPPWLPNPPSNANIVSAMREYRNQVACDVSLPLINGAPPDPAKTTLVIQTAPATQLTRVAGAQACGGKDWYNLDPQRGRLCPEACKIALASSTVPIVVQTSCP